MVGVALAGLAGAPSFATAQSGAQSGAARFNVDSVGDSTMTFPVGTAKWVARGQNGLAVEPRRHDELIARFKVIRVDGGIATALITGQTGRVLPGQVALIKAPASPFYRTGFFWIGTAVGAAVMFIATR